MILFLKHTKFKLQIKWIAKSYILWDITYCSCERYLLRVDFSLGLFIDPEDKLCMFFRNVAYILTDYTVLYLRR
jgi:hypothetical protein